MFPSYYVSSATPVSESIRIVVIGVIGPLVVVYDAYVFECILLLELTKRQLIVVVHYHSLLSSFFFYLLASITCLCCLCVVVNLFLVNYYLLSLLLSILHFYFSSSSFWWNTTCDSTTTTPTFTFPLRQSTIEVSNHRFGRSFCTSPIAATSQLYAGIEITICWYQTRRQHL